MLYDIGRGRVVRRAVRALRRAALDACPRCGRRAGAFGTTVPEHAAGLQVPVSGIAGDQQAALFGQACVAPGMTKNTYGTGSFVLTNVGATLPEPVDGLLTTVAWTLGAGRRHLRDGGRDLRHRRRDPVAARRPRHHRRSGGDRPARGERSPTPAACSWCPRSPASARRGGTRTRAARSSASRAARPARISPAPSSRRWRSRPPTSSTRSPSASGTAPPELRVDGGASVMDVLCQFQADLLGVDRAPGRDPGDDRARRRVPRRHRRRRVGVARSGERAVDRRRVVLARDGGRRTHGADQRVAPGGRAIARLGARLSRVASSVRGARSRLSYETAVAGRAGVGEARHAGGLGRDVLGLLGRVRVDVLVAGELRGSRTSPRR